MGVSILRALFFLPLLFAPGFGQEVDIGVDIGFTDKLIDGMSRFFNANDGGLSGNEGTAEDKTDSETGTQAGFVQADPSDFRAGKDKKYLTNYPGEWELVLDNSGVSAMHMQLMPHGEVLIFDSTVSGPSNMTGYRCIERPNDKPDCWAHSVMYDIQTGLVRPLHVLTDPWCSSGGLRSDGTFLGTGGFMDGDRSVRTVPPCPTCDWTDVRGSLGAPRWYSTQTMLPDGSWFLVGGRMSYNYEYLAPNGMADRRVFYSKFFDETTDLDENNLYPFVHLLPDGNLFIFSNSRAILFNPRTNQVVKEYPRLKGGSRNYPASGMSALLPIRLDRNNRFKKVEVIVCGGALPKAYRLADPERKGGRIFIGALQDCGRLTVSDKNPQWIREIMPSRRVMGDMVILPTGDLLMLNGAEQGASAWSHAAKPNYSPVLFSPSSVKDDRFKVLTASTIPRMYHSTAIVLPDATVLVGGSNTNPIYLFQNVEFQTELRLEKFYPPYLDPALRKYRPEIFTSLSDGYMAYGKEYNIKFMIPYVQQKVRTRSVMVTMYSPPFTTHGYSMNQRLIQLGIKTVVTNRMGVQTITALAPPSGRIAPPGYYLVFVVYRGIPSIGTWVKIM